MHSGVSSATLRARHKLVRTLTSRDLSNSDDESMRTSPMQMDSSPDNHMSSSTTWKHTKQASRSSSIVSMLPDPSMTLTSRSPLPFPLPFPSLAPSVAATTDHIKFQNNSKRNNFSRTGTVSQWELDQIEAVAKSSNTTPPTCLQGESHLLFPSQSTYYKTSFKYKSNSGITTQDIDNININSYRNNNPDTNSNNNNSTAATGTPTPTTTNPSSLTLPNNSNDINSLDTDNKSVSEITTTSDSNDFSVCTRTVGSFEFILSKCKEVIPYYISGSISGLTIVIYCVSWASVLVPGSLNIYFNILLNSSLWGCVIVELWMIAFSKLSTLFVGPIFDLLPFLSPIVTAMASSNSGGNSFITTILVFNSISSIISGIVLFILGYFKITKLMEYFPYPVAGGYYAGLGTTFVKGGLSVMTNVTLKSFSDVVNLFNNVSIIFLWLPGVVMGIVVFVLSFYVKTPMLHPIVYVLGIGSFYAVVLVRNGADLSEARSNGWLLPLPVTSLSSPSQFYDLWTTFNFNNIDIDQLKNGINSIMAIIFISVLNQELTINAIELSMGSANIISGLTGGPLNCYYQSTSQINFQSGGDSKHAMFAAVLIPFILLVSQFPIASYIPKYISGFLLIYAGLWMIYAWLIDSFYKLDKLEYLTVWIIMIVAIFLDFLFAVGIGILIACIIFSFKFSNFKVLRCIFIGNERPSAVARPREIQKWLSQHSSSALIFSLQGFIFFGSGKSLVNEIKKYISIYQKKIEEYNVKFNMTPCPKNNNDINNTNNNSYSVEVLKQDNHTVTTTPTSTIYNPPNTLAFLILDFTDILGIDPSGILSMSQALLLLKNNNIKLFCCGLNSSLYTATTQNTDVLNKKTIKPKNTNTDGVNDNGETEETEEDYSLSIFHPNRLYVTVEEAMENIEETILRRYPMISTDSKTLVTTNENSIIMDMNVMTSNNITNNINSYDIEPTLTRINPGEMPTTASPLLGTNGHYNSFPMSNNNEKMTLHDTIDDHQEKIPSTCSNATVYDSDDEFLFNYKNNDNDYDNNNKEGYYEKLNDLNDSGAGITHCLLSIIPPHTIDHLPIPSFPSNLEHFDISSIKMLSLQEIIKTEYFYSDHYEQNQIIFKKNDPCLFLIYILDGTVGVLAEDATNDASSSSSSSTPAKSSTATYLRKFSTGSLIGELGLVLNKKRNATVVALTSVNVRKLDSTHLISMNCHHPNLLSYFQNIIINDCVERLSYIDKFQQRLLT